MRHRQSSLSLDSILETAAIVRELTARFSKPYSCDLGEWIALSGRRELRRWAIPMTASKENLNAHDDLHRAAGPVGTGIGDVLYPVRLHSPAPRNRLGGFADPPHSGPASPLTEITDARPA